MSLNSIDELIRDQVVDLLASEGITLEGAPVDNIFANDEEGIPSSVSVPAIMVDIADDGDVSTASNDQSEGTAILLITGVEASQGVGPRAKERAKSLIASAKKTLDDNPTGLAEWGVVERAWTFGSTHIVQEAEVVLAICPLHVPYIYSLGRLS